MALCADAAFRRHALFCEASTTAIDLPRIAAALFDQIPRQPHKCLDIPMEGVITSNLQKRFDPKLPKNI
jgi:hypothetical protein